MPKKSTGEMTNKEREIRVYGVGNLLHKEMICIVGHLGVSVTDFVKTKLADIVHSYPEHYKRPFEDA